MLWLWNMSPYHTTPPPPARWQSRLTSPLILSMSHKTYFCAVTRVIFFCITSVYKILQWHFISLCPYPGFQVLMWSVPSPAFPSLSHSVFLLWQNVSSPHWLLCFPSILQDSSHSRPFAWSAVFLGTLSLYLCLIWLTPSSKFCSNVTLSESLSISTSSKIESFLTFCPTCLNVIILNHIWLLMHFFISDSMHVMGT